MVKRNILSSSLIIITLLILGIYISRERVYIQKKQNAIYKNLIGYNANKDCSYLLEIPNLKLKECLYNIDNPKNSLSYGLEILNLNPLVIAGHSGTGYLAIFKNIFQLNINDKVIINGEPYTIINMYTKDKNSYLKLESDLILVTCFQDKQLVILAKKAKI